MFSFNIKNKAASIGAIKITAWTDGAKVLIDLIDWLDAGSLKKSFFTTHREKEMKKNAIKIRTKASICNGTLFSKNWAAVLLIEKIQSKPKMK